ncbi:HNH endonuclease signature motif containing protein [soil metagenome]
MDEIDQLLDPARADVRIGFGLARAEYAHRSANRAAAEQWAAIDETLDEARCSPDVYVEPRFDLRPAERTEFAERAAAADLAVRLGLSEGTVRGQAADCASLRTRLPRFWLAFGDGDVAVTNARYAAELVRSLPDERELSRQFDDALVGIIDLAPVRFRIRARVLRDRVHTVALIERTKAAAETRGVWIENELDGMAFLSLKLPADVAHRAFARIDGAARSLAIPADETRTLAQLRADVAGEVLLDGGATTGSATRVSVAVTVPVMTLLGCSDEPAILDGYGPIDADTARRLAAHAPSFTRLLTHPISSALLDIDRATYRVPADLKRWLEITDVMCSFPGCGRLARNSDLDHTVDHQFGGATRADNLAHLCRHHHRLKHMTKWSVRANVEAAGRKLTPRVTWTSPTGYERDADPPPF